MPEPTANPANAPEPTVGNPEPTNPADVGQDVDERIIALEKQLAEEKHRAAEAGKVLEAERRERKRLEKAQMSEAERLADERKEIEEKARLYDRQINAVAAERLLTKAGLTEDDYKDFLDLFVSEDAEKTTAIAQGFVDILERQKKLSAKSEREKILKETPKPPGGDSSADVLAYEQKLKSAMNL